MKIFNRAINYGHNQIDIHCYNYWSWVKKFCGGFSVDIEELAVLCHKPWNCQKYGHICELKSVSGPIYAKIPPNYFPRTLTVIKLTITPVSFAEDGFVYCRQSFKITTKDFNSFESLFNQGSFLDFMVKANCTKNSCYEDQRILMIQSFESCKLPVLGLCSYTMSLPTLMSFSRKEVPETLTVVTELICVF